MTDERDEEERERDLDEEAWARLLADPADGVPDGPTTAPDPDLTTTYLGMELSCPVVASASPLTGHTPSLRALAAAGVGAVVLPSVFEEQITHASTELARLRRRDVGDPVEAPPDDVARLDGYNHGAVRHLDLLRRAKAILDVPVIASLNGVSRGGWTAYARMLADTGADAIELNLYRVAASADVTGRQVEADAVDLVSAVVRAAGVPVAVKLSPYYSALGNLAGSLVDAGAAGLVLFNRFHQPDVDLETLTVGPRLVLSDSDELRLPLRWMALLHGRVEASLAASTGVHEPADVVKALLAGADVAMTTSALLRHGPAHVGVLRDGLRDWLGARGFASASEARGVVSQGSATDPEAEERMHHLRTLASDARTFLP
jgi:dihydroorotate dehydrogenase (fumarate)